MRCSSRKQSGLVFYYRPNGVVAKSSSLLTLYYSTYRPLLFFLALLQFLSSTVLLDPERPLLLVDID